MYITHVLANKPTSVGIMTFITMMLLALTTTSDGGALLTTEGTHICLILSLILHGSVCQWVLKCATLWSPIPLKCIRRTTNEMKVKAGPGPYPQPETGHAKSVN